MLKCMIGQSQTVYEIADGAVFIENYNETLDSGTIIIQQRFSEIDIEPYDSVVIWSGDLADLTPQVEIKRMLVDSFTCTQTSLNPPIYKYEISLFSETKKLEGILCPSLSITKPLSGSQLSVLDYIKRYVDLYSPKKSSNPFIGAYENEIGIADIDLQRFANIECPEMQWSNPTLREVLTDLMMVDDCIPVLKQGYLGYIDISEVKSAASKSGINYIQKSQSSEDYVSSLRMNLVNAANNTPKSDTVPDDATKVVERIGFRNSESYLLDTKSMRLEASYPIWRIYECLLYLVYVCTVTTRTWVGPGEYIEHQYTALVSPSVDIAPYILEYDEWRTKSVYYGAWQANSHPPLGTDYKNTCLYYHRGGKIIDNFNEKVENQFLFIKDSWYVFQLMLADLSADMESQLASLVEEWVEENHPDEEYLTFTKQGSATGWRQVMFDLSYETIDECVFAATKSDRPRHQRQVVDNQSAPYPNIYRQGLLEYMKANRLGNKMIMANGRYYGREAEMPQLGQTIDGKVIFRKEISVYQHHIDANYLATENYVLRDYFTGVRSKLRTWRVVSGSDAFVRQDLVKFNVNSNLTPISNSTRKIPIYSTLDEYLQAFKYCAARFRIGEDSYLPGPTVYHGVSYSTNVVALEFSEHKVGSSVVFTVKFPDNFFAGNYISDYHGTLGAGADVVEQKGIPYADNDGRLIEIELYFYSKCNPFWLHDHIDEASQGLKPLANAGLNPNTPNEGTTFNSSDMVAKIPVLLYKDNKEIPQISIQFEMNPNATDIFLRVF